jgi:hypothetical protein
VVDALYRVKHKLLAIFTSVVVPVWITEVVKSCSEDANSKELIQQLAVTPTSCNH